MPVKVILKQFVRNLFPCAIVQQQTADNSLLGLYRVRRHTQLAGLFVRHGFGRWKWGGFRHNKLVGSALNYKDTSP